MNFGVNISTILSNFEQLQLEFGKEFFKREPVSSNDYDIKEMFNCTEEECQSFYKNFFIRSLLNYSLKSNVKETLRKLREQGNKICIIFPSVFADKNDSRSKLMCFAIREWLMLNGIQYDKLIHCTLEEDKADICAINCIDIMIENNQKDIEYLSQYVDVICFSGVKDNVAKNVKIINDFSDVFSAKALIEEEFGKEISRPLTGKPSVDKPWLKYYSRQAIRSKVPEMKFNEYLRRSVKDSQQGAALYYFNKKITNKKFFKLVDDCAKSFIELGLKEDDCITICMANTPEAYISMMAANTIGVVSNMLNVLSSKNEIMESVNITNSRVLVILDTNYNKIKDIINEMPSLERVIIVSPKNSMPIITKTLYTLAIERKNVDVPKNIQKEKDFTYWNDFIKLGKNYVDKTQEFMVSYKKGKPAVILRTSGSTKRSNSLPKMPVITDDAYTQIAHDHRYTLNFKNGDKIVAITPIHHGFGSSIAMYMPHCLGTAPIFEVNYDEKRFGKMFLKLKPSHVVGPPTLFIGIRKNKYLQGKNLSFFNGYAVSGGDKMKLVDLEENTKFLRAHHCGINIRDGYGQSEGLASIATDFFGKGLTPLINIDIKIVDFGTQNEVGYNVNGELCFSGPVEMIEYFMNYEATDEVLKKHDDGKYWIHTGDIYQINEDGILSFGGRIKYMFISSGYNVYPSEVERVIETHKAVKASAVIGANHSYKQTVPLAYIVLNDGVEFTDTLRHEIIQHCKDNLNHHSVPYRLILGNEIPKTPAIKTDYEYLESEYKNILIEEKSKVKVLD